MMMDEKDKKVIIKFVSIFLGVATVFVAVKALAELRSYQYIGRTPGSVNVITVSGAGEATARPDIAEVSFAITAEGSKVADVQKNAADIEKKALAFLKEKGIDDKDVKTSNYTLSPRYEYRQQLCTPTYCPPSGTRTLTGYEVREDVLVKVRAIDTAGSIVGGLGTLGVTNISGITLTVDDLDKVKREARADAIKDAKRKAETLAEDLGVSLTHIVSFNEDNGRPFYAAGIEKMGLGMGGDVATAPAPALPTGENTYTSTVTITYEID